MDGDMRDLETWHTVLCLGMSGIAADALPSARSPVGAPVSYLQRPFTSGVPAGNGYTKINCVCQSGYDSDPFDQLKSVYSVIRDDLHTRPVGS